MQLLSRFKKIRHLFFIFSFRFLKIKKNKIIFWSNTFKDFGDSPKYIALYLLKHYPGKFDLVWVFEQEKEIPKDFPKEIRVVRYFSIDYLKEIHTAKFVICNTRTNQECMWYKRKHQIYIQTWHSSLRLKKIEGDATTLSNSYIKRAKADSQKIDLLISGCEFSTNIFKNSFWYNGEILKVGTPRCDVLLNDTTKIKRKVFSHYDIPNNNQLILYAPTFRSSKNTGAYGMDFEFLNHSINKYNTSWSIGFRLHPNIDNQYNNEFFIPMSKHPDMQELIAASDILITDYSSCMFDMAIAKKPCILFVPDLDTYISNDRGLYFDISELPFPIAKNMQELTNAIINFDNIEYQSKLQTFIQKVGNYENGNASQKVSEYIIKKLHN